jgi:amidophosphoribosyltransferase
MVAASDQPRSRLCAACFTGEYPIPLPDEARLGKHLLEELSVPENVSGSTDPSALSVGYGAADALGRP